VRPLLYGIALVGAAALVSPDQLRSLGASAASALFECVPYVLASNVIGGLFRGRARVLVAYLGCGCTRGPGARSLPAAIAASLLFGPFVAIARVVAATMVARLLPPRLADDHGMHSPLRELRDLLASALAASIALHLVSWFDIGSSVGLQLVAGAALGFFAAPCALGGVMLAGALHVRAPIAAALVLAISGIVDLRIFIRTRHVRNERPVEHDMTASALLAWACVLVALRGGATLVHPVLAAALAPCALAFAVEAWRNRTHATARLRLVPALMLAGALVGAPPPIYYATETTLDNVFPGEHLSFTGALVRDHRAWALVRYAITCCRADAMPVVIRLAYDPHQPQRSWLRVDGVVARVDGELTLNIHTITRIASPIDPFVYR